MEVKIDLIELFKIGGISLEELRTVLGLPTEDKENTDGE
jgi:hypothetical protein